MKKSEKPEHINVLLLAADEHECGTLVRDFGAAGHGCSIACCGTVRAVRELLDAAESGYDCLVVDNPAGGIAGLQACQELLAAGVAVPLVILASAGSETVAAEALKAGVDDYIIKSPDGAYLQMVPMVLGEVVAAYRERLAHERSEQALRESRERLSGIVEGLTIPTFVIDADHVTTHWNEACARITGVPASEVIGTRQQWRAFYPAERPVMADLIVDRVIEAHVAQHYGGKYRHSEVLEEAYEAEDFFPHFGEGGRWLFFTAAPLKSADGAIIGAIETLQDVSERRRAEIALRESERRHRELSITDGLTGLYNSRHFYCRANDEVERRKSCDSPLSLLLMDVDNFKCFNDSYGHLEGDRVLTSLAEVIRREIRGGDSAYRYGGEEFVVLLPEAGPTEALVVAERLRSAFESLVFVPAEGEEVHMTVSIGGGRYRHEEGLVPFIKRVDQAMYRAKAAGKNRVLFVEECLDA